MCIRININCRKDGIHITRLNINVPTQTYDAIKHGVTVMGRSKSMVLKKCKLLPYDTIRILPKQPLIIRCLPCVKYSRRVLCYRSTV